MSIKSELKKHDLLLLEINPKGLHQKAISLLKSHKDSCIVYVTCSKTAKSIMSELAKKNVSTKNILFIDVITKTFQKTEKKNEQCVFIKSPVALTELSLTITSSLKRNVDLIIIDAITNFSIYNSQKVVEKFIANIAGKIKETGKKGIFLAARTSEQEKLIKMVEIFVDKSISM